MIIVGHVIVQKSRFKFSMHLNWFAGEPAEQEGLPVVILTVEDLKKAAEGKKKKEEKEKKKEEKLKKMLHAAQCKKSRSSTCHDKCDIDIMFCFKCKSNSFNGECFIICVNSENPKCVGKCESCSKQSAQTAMVVVLIRLLHRALNGVPL
ncbi:hypothetical protein VNO80_25728 [Phaseolus coccineus]|uniref:Uncharacterized protein n=1 Tax=Phaseolus coccineus TaxID=3886 RepID=A0AAN9LZW0_PHACN